MDNGSPIRGDARPVRRSRLRLAVMLLAGVLAALAAGLAGHWVEAPAVGIASLTYVVWVWLAVGRFDPAETRAHATVEDPSRGITDLLILAANVASLGAVAAVVVDSHASGGGSRFSGGLLALASVALSWMLVQTLFTLRYAELYYGTGGKAWAAVGGIDFNQERAPAVHRLRLSRDEPRHDVPGLGHCPAEPRHPGGSAQAQPAVPPLWHRHPGHDNKPRFLSSGHRRPFWPSKDPGPTAFRNEKQVLGPTTTRLPAMPYSTIPAA